MVFEKGHEKMGGREEGVKNKRTEFIEMLKEIDIQSLPERAIAENLEDILVEFGKLKGKDKVQLSQKFFEWIRPLLTRSETKLEVEEKKKLDDIREDTRKIAEE